ncbi:LacI family transcriptional regulator [Ruminiclostridium sufflavum DSM 19573]|uniref:LacI family transcriptional regulator n=1 Tax=Ruminiclostridium sufflavum DSM 19573 TaxID=1121337 RepID=A0A318XIB9_9FIRM|nr:LacI family DNA-binding transcriptional regulator [Ruminiclostridium sufflavum]PYG84860.1 LacI family transcriptional regulator [Ruminiclostridium sufflavum DSM 19573]
MTIKQIAEIAGVSASTVSRIINSPDNSFASKEVRDRVWAVIREYEYVPNQNAKSLKQANAAKHKRNSIVCVLGRVKNISENPFFEQITRAVEQHSLSVEVVVSNILTSNYDSSFLDDKGNFGNAIVIGRINESQIKAIEQRYKNVVYVGRNPLDTAFDQVICDGREATEKAMTLLLKNGHKHIAYFGETTNEVRFQAYAEAMKKISARQEQLCAINVPHTVEGGYSAAEQLLKKWKTLPTAVFCASDSIAIAAMRRFRESRIKIPEDLSVIGMDNIELSAYVSPMLTTVEMPAVEMGTIAVNILLDRINKGHKLPVKIILPSKLIERESVWPQGYIDKGSYI